MFSEKRGLMQIGFVPNIWLLDQICSRVFGSCFDKEEFETCVEDNWKNRKNIICYDRNNNVVPVEYNKIISFLVGTPYCDGESGEKMYAKFKNKCEGCLGEKASFEEFVTAKNIFCGRQKDSVDNSETFKDFSFYDTEIIGSVVNDYRMMRKEKEKVTLEEMSKLLDVAFEREKKKNKIKEWGEICFFCVEDNIYVTCKKNGDVRVKQRWYGSKLLRKEDLMEQMALRVKSKERNNIFPANSIGWFCFDDGLECENFFDDLARKALSEPWQFKDDIKSNTVLKSYLEHTYYRLKELEENKQDTEECYVYQDNNYIAFNSGLLSKKWVKPLIIKGEKKTIRVKVFDDEPEWEWHYVKSAKVYEEGNRVLMGIPDLPVAKYFAKIEDLLFHAERKIKIQDEHIFEGRLDRVRFYRNVQLDKVSDEKREELMGDALRRFNEAVKKACEMAKRNYKFVLPIYYRTGGTMQFLLPIYFDDEDAECALVLDWDAKAKIYRGSTILDLKMAYTDARLICRPDVFWLSNIDRICNGVVCVKGNQEPEGEDTLSDIVCCEDWIEGRLDDGKFGSIRREYLKDALENYAGKNIKIVRKGCLPDGKIICQEC